MLSRPKSYKPSGGTHLYRSMLMIMMMMITMQLPFMLSLWHSHCESSIRLILWIQTLRRSQPSLTMSTPTTSRLLPSKTTITNLVLSSKDNIYYTIPKTVGGWLDLVLIKTLCVQLWTETPVCFDMIIFCLLSVLLANVNVLRYVCYMRSQFRLSSVCRLWRWCTQGCSRGVTRYNGVIPLRNGLQQRYPTG